MLDMSSWTVISAFSSSMSFAIFFAAFLYGFNRLLEFIARHFEHVRASAVLAVAPHTGAKIVEQMVDEILLIR